MPYTTLRGRAALRVVVASAALIGSAWAAVAPSRPSPLSLTALRLREGVPTGQPATRGQDEQICGFLDLPEDFFLSQRVSDSMTKSGVWESDAGGTFLTWTQDLFAYKYQTVYFYVDSRLLFKAEVIDNDEIQLGRKLPMRTLKDEKDKWTVIALKDCQDVLLYTLLESNTGRHVAEIYNRADELVAFSRPGATFPDQIHYFDSEKAPIAISQSPMVTDHETPTAGGSHREDVAIWEVQYLHGYNSNSSLVIPQYRWVLGAAIQERAIRSALGRTANGDLEKPSAYFWFLALCIVGILVLAAAVCGCCFRVYRLVYPDRYEEVSNLFLKDSNVYGALEVKPWGANR